MSVTLPDAQWPLFQKMVRRTVQVQSPKGESTGTGVIISEQGLILTAHHVVTGCKHVRVRRCRLADDGWELLTEGRYTADVIFEDKNADIAVLLLRKPPKSLDVAKVGSSELLRIGEAVYRVGMDEYQMVGGHVISQTKTCVVGSRRLKIPGFAVSMRANVGASGGPIFDTALELVGISHSVSREEKEPSISYCIPIHAVVRRVLCRKAVKSYLLEKA